MARGIDPHRVAELLTVPTGRGPRRRGSGYRVTSTAVLTAEHVVREASVQVRFDADRPSEWLTPGEVAWADRNMDLAVVTINPGDNGDIEPVSYGRVGERDAVLPCSAMGFPLFKLRVDRDVSSNDSQASQYRDSVHAVGSIAVLSNRREGTLEVTVSPPERDPDPRASPWHGMSGAAVWSNERIVGVISEHHRSDGLGRLAATRVDGCYQRLSAQRLEGLAHLVGLPAHERDLVDVVPPTAGEVLEAAYTAQVRDIVPDGLLGREQDLARLVRFCAGDEPYEWWQGGPWTGKTALAAWAVLHPPGGVQVASFFVTGRLVGQADSDAFSEAMIEQLALLAGQSISPTASRVARDGERRRLFEQAAARIGERRGRLLLVIDGLDEDQGARPGSGRPSIASLLPKHPPEAMRVLVTSRPHPGIPGDVPSDHPLRWCTFRTLSASPYARDVQIEAKQELREQLHGDPVQVDLVAFITASGGGLTLTELAELTGEPEFRLDGRLGSAFGRSLRTRATWAAPDRPERVYLFAHETLRAIAEGELAHDLHPYLERIHDWADSYRAQGWPPNTPRYLLRPYGRLLVDGEDLERLIAFAADPRRHDRMLAQTQGDAASLGEITAAQRRSLSQPVPDLTALALLALQRDRLVTRSQVLPTELPVVWARLGQVDRAEALARNFTDPGLRARALAGLAQTLAGTDPDRARKMVDEAEGAADAVPESSVRASALRGLVGGLVGLKAWERAEQLAHAITDPNEQAGALGLLAEELARTGERHRAERVVRAITQPDARVWVLSRLIAGLTETDSDRARLLADEAEQEAGAIAEPGGRVWALARLARGLAGLDPDRARRLVGEAEQVSRAVSPGVRSWALCGLAEGLIGVGEWDRAEQVAGAIAEPGGRGRTLAILAQALAGLDPDRARRLVGEAEQVTRAARPVVPPWVLRRLAEGLIGIGEWDRAERILTAIVEPEEGEEPVWPLGRPAEGRAGGEEWDQKDHASGPVPEPGAGIWAMAKLAERPPRTDPDRGRRLVGEAEQVAAQAPEPGARVWAFARLAQGLAGMNPERARRLVGEADQLAGTITDPRVRAWALHGLVEGLVGVGEWDRAEQVAGAILDPHEQVWATARLTEGLARAGEWDWAEKVIQGWDAGRCSSDERAVPLGSLLAVAARSQVGDAKTRAEATQLLAPILIEDHWWRVLPVLGQLSPPTVLAVYAAWFTSPGGSSGSDPAAGNRLAFVRGRGRHRQTGSRDVRRPGRL